MPRPFCRIAGGLLLFWSWSCSRGEPRLTITTEHRVMMDTDVAITVYAPPADSSARIHQDIERAFAAFNRIDSLMSSYRDDSEVAKINRRAAGEAVPITAAMDSVVQTSLWASRLSAGAFDITIAPVLWLWGFGTDHLGLPDSQRIADALPLVGYRHLVAGNGTLHFLQTGMGIDLGGVAKGYAVDVAVETLARAGYRDVMIKAGGDLRARSSPLTRGRRHIWIQHPRAADKFFGKFLFDEGAVSTSGDYERFFEVEGVRYHHVMDPQTGYPARRAVSATVLARHSVTADALDNALFVLGPERGIALADSLPGIEAVVLSIVADKIQWRATRGLAGRLEIIEDRAKP